MMILSGGSLSTSRCERGLVDCPFSCTQHCSVFQHLGFSPHSILPSWAHAQFTEEKGAREVNGIGQGSAAGWPPRLGLRTPVLQCKSPYSWGLLPAPTFSQLFSSFLHGAPCPGQAHLGQGRWGRVAPAL